MTDRDGPDEISNADMSWVAEHLIRISIEVFMERFSVDRETARTWVLRAAEAAP